MSALDSSTHDLEKSGRFFATKVHILKNQKSSEKTFKSRVNPVVKARQEKRHKPGASPHADGKYENSKCGMYGAIQV